MKGLKHLKGVGPSHERVAVGTPAPRHDRTFADRVAQRPFRPSPAFRSSEHVNIEVILNDELFDRTTVARPQGALCLVRCTRPLLLANGKCQLDRGTLELKLFEERTKIVERGIAPSEQPLYVVLLPQALQVGPHARIGDSHPIGDTTEPRKRQGARPLEREQLDHEHRFLSSQWISKSGIDLQKRVADRRPAFSQDFRPDLRRATPIRFPDLLAHYRNTPLQAWFQSGHGEVCLSSRTILFYFGARIPALLGALPETMIGGGDHQLPPSSLHGTPSPAPLALNEGFVLHITLPPSGAFSRVDQPSIGLLQSSTRGWLHQVRAGSMFRATENLGSRATQDSTSTQELGTERLMNSATITEIRFSGASNPDRATGLLGYVSFLLNGSFRVDGVTLRRTAAGRLVLSYPARRDRRGRDHAIFFPIDDASRLRIERQVFRGIGDMFSPEVPE